MDKTSTSHEKLGHLNFDIFPSMIFAEAVQVDFAREHIGHVFTTHEIEALSKDAIEFTHRQAEVGSLIFNDLRYGSELVIVAPPLPDFYLFQITISGTLIITSPTFTSTLNAGSVFVMNPGIPFRKHWHKDSRQLIVKIPVRVMQRRLMLDLRENFLRTVEFVPRPATEPAIEPLLAYTSAICRDLALPSNLCCHSTVAEQMENSVLSALLAVIPNNHSDLLRGPPSSVAPYYVNRAEKYLRLNAAANLSMLQIAQAAGVSERTLQQGFRRFRGFSPMEALRNIRLDIARAALIDSANADRSVTSVAMDCGFGHLGRFAMSYAERFAETPSETLRRNRALFDGQPHDG